MVVLWFMDCHRPSAFAMTKKELSLRGLEKPVAISVWDTIIYSWDSFSFLFLYLLLVVYGLLRFAHNDEGGEW